MAARVSIAITLAFETPPSVAGAGASGSRADRAVQRNASGQFIIPGSQVKGKLRHACEQLLRAAGCPVCHSPRAETMCPNDCAVDTPCPICKVFGNPASPSPLKFQDLLWQDDVQDGGEPVPASLRAMTAINRRRGTVEPKRLFVVETVPHLPTLRFSNQEAVVGKLDNEAQVRLLLAGFGLITGWGGMKSRGLGWADVKRVEIGATYDGKEVKPDRWNEVKQLWSS
jgi:CRISPR/Cas system CSM-associated protein Csm3 (group 7 of RAMP superfamily)